MDSTLSLSGRSLPADDCATLPVDVVVASWVAERQYDDRGYINVALA
jgi:hypothetical protein